MLRVDMHITLKKRVQILENFTMKTQYHINTIINEVMNIFLHVNVFIILEMIVKDDFWKKCQT